MSVRIQSGSLRMQTRTHNLQSKLDDIKLSSLELEDGATITVFCPFCRAEHEDKLSITRKGTSIAYYCFRASCHQSGVIGEGGDFQRLKGKKKTFKPKPYRRETCELSEGLLEELYTRYGLSEDILVLNGVVQERYSDSRLVFPIMLKGVQIGMAFKDIKTGVKFKAITYRSVESEVLYFPISDVTSGPVHLVEGCLDALKLSMLGVRSCALLGTHLGTSEAIYLSKHCNELVWMLDKDAVNVAFRLAKQYALLFTSRVIPMQRDPKDTPLEELRRLI